MSNVRRHRRSTGCVRYGNAVSFRVCARSPETQVFIRYANEVWSEAERQEFINFIASNPEAGSIIRGSGGCRKVRWSRTGTGKQGGTRVIYFLAPEGTVWLLIVYTKAKFDNLPTSFIAKLKQGVQDVL